MKKLADAVAKRPTIPQWIWGTVFAIVGVAGCGQPAAPDRVFVEGGGGEGPAVVPSNSRPR